MNNEGLEADNTPAAEAAPCSPASTVTCEPVSPDGIHAGCVCSVAEGMVLGSLPMRLGISMSVLGQPEATLAECEGVIGAIVAGPLTEGGGNVRQVRAIAPGKADMYRAAAEILETMVPELRAIADQIDDEDDGPGDDGDGQGEPDDGGPGGLGAALPLVTNSRTACCKETREQACPDGTGPLAEREGEADGERVPAVERELTPV